MKKIIRIVKSEVHRRTTVTPVRAGVECPTTVEFVDGVARVLDDVAVIMAAAGFEVSPAASYLVDYSCGCQATGPVSPPDELPGVHPDHLLEPVAPVVAPIAPVPVVSVPEPVVSAPEPAVSVQEPVVTVPEPVVSTTEPVVTEPPTTPEPKKTAAEKRAEKAAAAAPKAPDAS